MSAASVSCYPYAAYAFPQSFPCRHYSISDAHVKTPLSERNQSRTSKAQDIHTRGVRTCRTPDRLISGMPPIRIPFPIHWHENHTPGPSQQGNGHEQPTQSQNPEIRHAGFTWITYDIREGCHRSIAGQRTCQPFTSVHLSQAYGSRSFFPTIARPPRGICKSAIQFSIQIWFHVRFMPQER